MYFWQLWGLFNVGPIAASTGGINTSAALAQLPKLLGCVAPLLVLACVFVRVCVVGGGLRRWVCPWLTRRRGRGRPTCGEGASMDWQSAVGGGRDKRGGLSSTVWCLVCVGWGGGPRAGS